MDTRGNSRGRVRGLTPPGVLAVALQVDNVIPDPWAGVCIWPSLNYPRVTLSRYFSHSLMGFLGVAHGGHTVPHGCCRISHCGRDAMCLGRPPASRAAEAGAAVILAQSRVQDGANWAWEHWELG